MLGRDVSATYNLFVTGFKCISAKAVRVCFLKDQISGGGTDPDQIPAVFLVPAYNIGKRLNQAEMREAFVVMQNQFAPFTGEAVEIGLARTNPYRDLCKIKLK